MGDLNSLNLVEPGSTNLSIEKMQKKCGLTFSNQKVRNRTPKSSDIYLIEFRMSLEFR